LASSERETDRELEPGEVFSKMVFSPTSAVMNFSRVRKGMRVRILSVPADTPENQRLLEMGLVPGTEFRVVKVAPLGDPVDIELRGYRLCLRKKETAGVEVEEVG
jgi:ferrous iron transport protein A